MIRIALYTYIFILGAVVGSFLNVCIYRIPYNKSITFPPSHCMSCSHILGVVDLFPIISFLFFRGKCRYCGEKISIQYPLVELCNAVLYVVVFINFGLSYYCLFYLFFVSYLIVIFMIDIKTKIIPNNVNLLGSFIGLVFVILKSLDLSSFYPVKISLIGLLVGLIPLLLIIVISKGGMGAGDMKLMAVIGFWLGAKKTYIAFLLGIIFAVIIVIVLMFLKKASSKSKIPFAPFLTSGSLLSLICGEQIFSSLFFE